MNHVIYYAGEFNKPEQRTQYLKSYLLFLYLRGFDYMRVCAEKKEPPEVAFPEAMDTPLLALFPPGTLLDFSANESRENWAMIFDSAELSNAGEGLCSLHGAMLLPFVRLSEARAAKLRGLFAVICANLNAGHLPGAEKAKLLTGALIAELIAGSPQENRANPAAAALKDAIDRDVHFTRSVSEINARLRLCSLPQMRKLFLEAYGILPGEYRSRQRLNRIMELFSQTDYSLKMIADEVGMKHLPHLYAFLKEKQELSPKELLLQFRGRKSNS